MTDPQSARSERTGRSVVEPLRLPATVLGLGLALGLFSSIGDSLPIENPLIVLVAMANAAGPWLVAAFFAGAIQGHARRGALAGFLTLGIAVGIYYLYMILVWGQQVSDVPARAAIAWIGVAAAFGPLLGGVGGGWAARIPRYRVWGPAILSGGLLAEAAHRFIELEAWQGIDIARTSMQVAMVDATAAVILLLVLVNRDRLLTGFAAAVGVAVAGLAAITVIEVLVRAFIA